MKEFSVFHDESHGLLFYMDCADYTPKNNLRQRFSSEEAVPRPLPSLASRKPESNK